MSGIYLIIVAAIATGGAVLVVIAICLTTLAHKHMDKLARMRNTQVNARGIRSEVERYHHDD
jgi:hypothetical protein